MPLSLRSVALFQASDIWPDPGGGGGGGPGGHRTPPPPHTHTHTLFLPIIGHVAPMNGVAEINHSVAPRDSGVHLWTAKPPLLLIHLLHLRHCIAPFCCCIGFYLSDLHLCLFKSPGLLKLLPHSLHWIAPPGSDWLPSSGEHRCTARPPLLRNQRPHTSH